MKKSARHWIVAMDGPAGVGKSTVGQLMAKRLKYRFINTGEMYRALTWKALKEKVNVTDSAAVVRLAKRLKWEFKPADGGVTLQTYIDGECVAGRIRDEKVSQSSSAVAGIPEVRRILRNLQRRLGKDGGIVMEGRDITTNVFPKAEIKVYLDASIDERATRRYRQLQSAGHKVSLDRIKADILARDRRDLERRINPLRQAEDAIVIDSTHLSLREVADRILEHIRAKRNGNS